MLGHSYNFLSFGGLKINSASPGGRAGKNAIGDFNHTSNVLRVKVLSRVENHILMNDLLYFFPAQVIIGIAEEINMQNSELYFSRMKTPHLSPDFELICPIEVLSPRMLKFFLRALRGLRS